MEKYFESNEQLEKVFILWQIYLDFCLIDCRYPYEFNGGHIKKAENLYLYDQISTRFFGEEKKWANKDSVVFKIFPRSRSFSTRIFFQKITLGDFWMENFPIFPIRNIPEYDLRNFSWGAETIWKNILWFSRKYPKRVFTIVF